MEKIYKLDSIETNNFFPSKLTIKRGKEQLQKGRRHCHKYKQGGIISRIKKTNPLEKMDQHNRKLGKTFTSGLHERTYPNG